MIPKGPIPSDAASRIVTTAEADANRIVRAIHTRISNIETSVLDLARAVPSKLERYGIPAAVGLLGLILGHLL
jgi:hypothetical protein